MISPELLRRYSFFAALSPEQLKQIAMLSDEISINAGVTILHECKEAQDIYLLIDGGVDIYFCINSEKEFFVAEINPGEVFGISSMIEPFEMANSVRASKPSRAIKLSAVALRQACAQDKDLAVAMYRQIAKSAIERLNATRVQLVASR